VARDGRGRPARSRRLRRAARLAAASEGPESRRALARSSRGRSADARAPRVGARSRRADRVVPRGSRGALGAAHVHGRGARPRSRRGLARGARPPTHGQAQEPPPGGWWRGSHAFTVNRGFAPQPLSTRPASWTLHAGPRRRQRPAGRCCHVDTRAHQSLNLGARPGARTPSSSPRHLVPGERRTEPGRGPKSALASPPAHR
jgi:hypothetical protein